MIRHADEVRDFIRDNLLTTYQPAVAWQEDSAPFKTLGNNIIYCRQEGQAVDAFVRNVSVDVYLFSKQGATNADLNQLYIDSVNALNYVKYNYNINDGETSMTVTQDVTGEYYTGQNRVYYRFSVLCRSVGADDS